MNALQLFYTRLDDHGNVFGCDFCLYGRAGSNGSDLGPTVCACFDVGRQTVLDFIRQTAAPDIDSIGRSLKAGTNCGSCRPELAGLLSEAVGRCD